MTAFMTEAEARAIRDEWEAVTEPEPGYDEQCPVRVSSSPALLPIAKQIPNKWLGGDHAQTYSALITGVSTQNEWFVILVAGGNRREVKAAINDHWGCHALVGGTA